MLMIAVEVSLVLVFAIGLFKLIYFARDLSRTPDASHRRSRALERKDSNLSGKRRDLDRGST